MSRRGGKDGVGGAERGGKRGRKAIEVMLKIPFA